MCLAAHCIPSFHQIEQSWPVGEKSSLGTSQLGAIECPQSGWEDRECGQIAKEIYEID